MQCADLERYLEAFLDGRLGRARGGLLRRHLAGCVTCRSRYEALRDFERDLNRRLRAMEPSQSVWAGLELDLVRSSHAALPQHVESRPRALLPPPPAPLLVLAPSRTQQPQPKRTVTKNVLASRLVGIVLLAAAVGAIVQVGHRLAPGGGQEASGLLARLDTLKPPPPETLNDGDYGTVRAWLASWFGSTPPPLPQAAGFQLIGARIEGSGDQRVGVVLYRAGESTVSLHIRPVRGSDHYQTLRGLESSLAMLKGTGWIDGGFAYAVSSTLAFDTVAPLRHSVGAGAL